MRFPAQLFALAVCLFACSQAGAVEQIADPQVTLTEAELQWITLHPVVRVGLLGESGPYCFTDNAGKLIGLDPDFLALIARRTGLRFDSIPNPVWAQVFDDLRGGKLDMICGIGRTMAREEYLTYCRPYMFSPDVIVTRHDTPILFDTRDLDGFRIGIARSNPAVKASILARSPGAIVVEYDNMREAILAVAGGQNYAAVTDAVMTAFITRSDGLSNLRLGVMYDDKADVHMAVRKDWPVLVGIINKALASITASERNALKDHWLAVDYETDRWWLRAFKIAAGTVFVAALFLLLQSRNSRRLARELEERRRIQAELEQTRDRLVQISQEKSGLMHMMAHDLRSPLTAIQLNADLLQFDPPVAGGALLAAAGQIKNSADQMARLINALLSAQSAEEGRITLRFAAGDAVQPVRAAMQAMDLMAQQKRITVDAQLPTAAIPLNTDFVALRQVIDNLLSNAIKYSPLGSRVAVRLTANATHCRLEVRDEGPGVPAAEREKIFEKFSRGSAQPTHGEQSIGLGLWIVRRFVITLHGRVWCEPGPGSVGSMFVVEIPLVPPGAN